VRLPEILAVVGALIGERFFLAQVEGANPWWAWPSEAAPRPGGPAARDTVKTLAYFDDYGPDNGATRIVPGSHRLRRMSRPSISMMSPGRCSFQHRRDILVFDADLVHAGSLNPTGARRRSILISYFAEPLYASHLKTAHLRSIRMDTVDRFD